MAIKQRENKMTQSEKLELFRKIRQSGKPLIPVYRRRIPQCQHVDIRDCVNSIDKPEFVEKYGTSINQFYKDIRDNMPKTV